MIAIENLTKRYVDTCAIEDLSFKVEEGEILGFLGPNGAGKTTTLRILTGFLQPTSGRARVAGFDVVADSLEVRKRIGYLPENVPLYPEMRVEEYLGFRAAIRRVPRNRRKSSVERAMELCGLTDHRHRLIGVLSKGYRQRVGLADALVHSPPILILDEPTVGLDPNQIREVRGLIKELGKDHTVILSTHILPEVEMVCSRVAIIARGKLVAEGPPDQLRERLQGEGRIVVELRAPESEAREALERLDGVRWVKERGPGGEFELGVSRGADPREAIFRLAVARGWVLLGLRRDTASLEEVFARLTTEEESDTEAQPEQPRGAASVEEQAGDANAGDGAEGKPAEHGEKRNEPLEREERG